MTPFELDLLMAARYAYYVLRMPFLMDHDYDARERDYAFAHGRLPVGSELREDYSDAQRALAMYFICSGRGVPAPGDELL